MSTKGKRGWWWIVYPEQMIEQRILSKLLPNSPSLSAATSSSLQHRWRFAITDSAYPEQTRAWEGTPSPGGERALYLSSSWTCISSNGATFCYLHIVFLAQCCSVPSGLEILHTAHLPKALESHLFAEILKLLRLQRLLAFINMNQIKNEKCQSPRTQEWVLWVLTPNDKNIKHWDWSNLKFDHQSKVKKYKHVSFPNQMHSWTYLPDSKSHCQAQWKLLPQKCA